MEGTELRQAGFATLTYDRFAARGMGDLVTAFPALRLAHHFFPDAFQRVDKAVDPALGQAFFVNIELDQ
jgi:hypothetical protein